MCNYEQKGAGPAPNAATTPVDPDARVTARATVWMVVLNLPLAVAAVVGLWFSHATLVEQRASAQSAEQTFQADERAWVMIPPLRVIETKKNPNGAVLAFSYELNLKNTGKTAAHGVIVKILSFQNPIELQASVKDIAAIEDKERFGESLKSQEAEAQVIRAPASAPGTLAPAEIISVTKFLSAYPPNYQQRDTFTYFIGRVDYTDAFGAAHWLTFCQFVPSDAGELRYCAEGNDRDPELAKPAPGAG
jgi:hypothetical protein